LLDSVVTITRRAGEAIMAIYRSGSEVRYKNDDSPLTAADLAAQRIIHDELHRLTPELPQLSEEASPPPYAVRAEWNCYWLIDPLDGTKEFIQRNGEFTVNIALIREHRPVLGVVYAPAVDICHYAAEDVGAFRRQGISAPEPIRARECAPDVPKVVGSRLHGTPETTAYLHRLGPHEFRAVGSSLKFCRVAEGSADLYPRLGPTSEWDTAAGQCVVEQAGGLVTDWRGAPLRYNGKESLLNPNFLVFGDRRRDWLASGSGLPWTSRWE
jgi:3'(2'), 5'-bisphosphate nucleotidase